MIVWILNFKKCTMRICSSIVLHHSTVPVRFQTFYFKVWEPASLLRVGQHFFTVRFVLSIVRVIIIWPLKLRRGTCASLLFSMGVSLSMKVCNTRDITKVMQYWRTRQKENGGIGCRWITRKEHRREGKVGYQNSLLPNTRWLDQS